MSRRALFEFVKAKESTLSQEDQSCKAVEDVLQMYTLMQEESKESSLVSEPIRKICNESCQTLPIHEFMHELATTKMALNAKSYPKERTFSSAAWEANGITPTYSQQPVIRVRRRKLREVEQLTQPLETFEKCLEREVNGSTSRFVEVLLSDGPPHTLTEFPAIDNVLSKYLKNRITETDESVIELASPVSDLKQEKDEFPVHCIAYKKGILSRTSALPSRQLNWTPSEDTVSTSSHHLKPILTKPEQPSKHCKWKQRLSLKETIHLLKYKEAEGSSSASYLHKDLGKYELAKQYQVVRKAAKCLIYWQISLTLGKK
ncbi:hypothetical protein BDR26DRAFT_864612 [Obelidium mucronatum]|nr:hypothetical protein BDR26DRAFT_864612 [Obelidium mucronatum]